MTRVPFRFAGTTVLAGIVALTGGTLSGQDILSQFRVPHPQEYSAPYFVESQFVTPDGAGRLFMFNQADFSLHKFDSTGKELWTITIGIASLHGFVTGMAVTSSAVYLAGVVTGALPGQTSAGSVDVFVRKYDLNGVELWTRQFGTADGDYVQAIAPDRTGVYILGSKDGSAAGSAFIRRYDAAGTEIWTRRFDRGTPPDIFGAVADSTGVYFFGYDTVRKFDSAGNDVWTRQFGRSAFILGVAPDDQGAYVLFFPSTPEYSVRRLDLAGSESWTRLIASSYAFGVIAADTTGFYVAGETGIALPGQCYAGQGDAFLMRFDTRGNTQWARQFGTAGPERPAEISIGASSVDVTGFGLSPDAVFLTRIEKSPAPVTGSQPRILWECVLNAADYLGGGVAPGEIVTILGSAMGPSQLTRLQVASDGSLATKLAGARILFNGQPAPLIYVSEKQSSAIVPYSVAGKSTVDVQVEYNGALSSAVRMPVFESRVGIFSFGTGGSGQAAILNEDGTINSSFNPAARGSVVSIYATGAGLPQPLGPDDHVTGDGPSKFKSTAYIRLTNDGSCDTPYFAAEVLYYGGAPRSVPGLVQINARLPVDVPAGDAVPLYFGFSANPDTGIEQVVTIAVR